jgi:ABC-type Fe3+/spermidine/putrescine transport system ATPase subunit
MLEIQDISFSYTQDKEVLNSISFSAEQGEYIAIVGESGCGKSTLLELIYGLLEPAKGRIFWNNTKLLGPNSQLIPGEEFMKYLPQDFDLMPFISVAENVGKYVSRLDRNREKRIVELLEVVDMREFAKTKVKNLSGGQKQRVAIAKVLAKEPEVLLLDEPFSHIDNFRKNKLRRNLFSYLKLKKIICIVATHDVTDALSFADEIVIIKEGQIALKNTPENLYSNPNDVYSASFFNEINEIPENLINPESNTRKTVLFYPEDVQIDTKSTIQAKVKRSYFKGSHYLVESELQSGLQIYFNHNLKLDIDEIVRLKFTQNEKRTR